MNDEARQDATALAAIQRGKSGWEDLTEAQRDEYRLAWQKDDRERTSREVAQFQANQLEESWCKLCPEIYRENLDPTRLNGKADAIAQTMTWKYGPIGMLLLGPTGQGKTRCSWHALKKAHFAGYKIHAIDGIGFALEAAAAAYSPEKTEQWMSRLTAPDILYIDDLAKRFTATSGQLLFGLVERRVSARKPIVITTNLTSLQLETVINDPELSKPLIRRLREFCNPITL